MEERLLKRAAFEENEKWLQDDTVDLTAYDDVAVPKDRQDARKVAEKKQKVKAKRAARRPPAGRSWSISPRLGPGR